MEKLDEKQEPSDVVSRNIDLEEGIILDVSMDALQKIKNLQKTKKTIFKEVHEKTSESTFIDIDEVKTILEETSINFNDSFIESVNVDSLDEDNTELYVIEENYDYISLSDLNDLDSLNDLHSLENESK